MVESVALDADDTLWLSEVHFVDVEERFGDLLGRYCSEPQSTERLIDVERSNLRTFGYGVKAFTLSMIETAITITEGAVSADDIHAIVGWGKEMMDQPVELLDGVGETVTELAERYEIYCITKGDLWHQEAKIAESGLADYFSGVEIVSEKDVTTYRRILAARQLDPRKFAMAGNSLRSDVLPIVELGGHGIHIPYEHLAGLERGAQGSVPGAVYHTIESIRELPGLLEEL